MPPKALTLRQNFSLTFVGNIVYAASQWGILVVLAKFGSPEMVDQFTLGLAVTAPVILFTSLQLRQIQATDVQQKYLFGDYLGLREIASTAGYRYPSQWHRTGGKIGMVVTWALVLMFYDLPNGVAEHLSSSLLLVDSHSRIDRCSDYIDCWCPCFSYI